MTQMNFDPGEAAVPPAPVFLVLERDVLIAADIVGSLSAMGPCRAIEVRNADEARKRIETEPTIATAFVALHYDQVVEAGLDQSLARRGAHIVLTVGENEQESLRARGWSVLVRPFTDQMIRDKVQVRAVQPVDGPPG